MHFEPKGDAYNNKDKGAKSKRGRMTEKVALSTTLETTQGPI